MSMSSSCQYPFGPRISGRLERVEDLHVGRVADIERLEAEAARDDQDVAARDLVELPFDHLLRAGYARDVLE